MESTALKNNLDIDSALYLIVLYFYPLTEIATDQNIISGLCNKGLCEYNEKEIKVTSKGAILAKSLYMTLKKI